VLSVGQKILVQITKVDDRGKLSLQPVIAEEADTEGRGATTDSSSEPAEGSAETVEA
jgi:polyribonucleotide nucleotidyltransferase